MSVTNKTKSSPNFTIGLLFLTGIFLIAWAAYAYLNPQVVISWSTASELNTAGYMLERSGSEEGPFEIITPELIAGSSDALSGGSYQYIDYEVKAGQTYYYMLIEHEYSGATNLEGPIMATANQRGIPEGILGFVTLAIAIYVRRINKFSPPGIQQDE